MTDHSKIYHRLGKLKNGVYEHSVTNHRKLFVNADDDDIHIQNIENIWMRVKRKLKYMFGSKPKQFVSHLDEFLWRERFKPNYFANMLICIQHYNNV